jgi:hypothetical protein
VIVGSAVIDRGELGIDTVRIGGEATLRSLTRRQEAGWQVSAATDETGRAVSRMLLRTLACGARLQFMRPNGRGADRAFIEFSVPKLLVGNNVRPASLNQAQLAVSAVVVEASDFVQLHQTKLNRLDVARDFTGIDHIAPVLLALSATPIAGRKTRVQYGDATLGGVQTLVVLNGDGSCRAYDKYAESGSPEALGRLRVEAQERRRNLRSAGIERWDALTEQQIYDVGRSRFEWAGMHWPVRSISDAIARILGAALSGAAKCKLVGCHELHRLGLDSQLDSTDRSRFRRALADLGAFGSEHADGALRLDYNRGLLLGAEAE